MARAFCARTCRCKSSNDNSIVTIAYPYSGMWIVDAKAFAGALEPAHDRR